MKLNKAFGEALRAVRLARGLTQEDFGLVSSRTYLSTLERGLKSVTLEKEAQLAKVLSVHPLTVITLAYAQQGRTTADDLLERIKSELVELGL